MKRFSLWLAAIGLAGTAAWGGSPDRAVVAFAVTNDVGFGNNVHVVGSHPDVGSWDPVQSVKLRWTTGNVWVGLIAVEQGTDLEYKYITRSIASNLYCVGTNAIWEPGDNRTVSIPPGPDAPFAGKTLYYHTGWTNPAVIYQAGADTNFYAAAMTAAGPGRSPGETLFRADGLGGAGDWMQFVITDNNGNFDRSPFFTGVGAGGSNYFTRLDALVLQDGHLFNYWPAASVSAPRIEQRDVGSSYSNILGRKIHIILPRGYDSHPWKRYPVVYFQDGQNITNGADAFGNGGWEADLTAWRGAAGGRLREAILVGVDNIPDRRRWEYNPPGDTYPGEQTGRADDYLKFLVDNVRPTLDFNYRTLTDRRNTFVAGSSMGGIFSLYAVLETNVFGGAIAMSPALTRAPNYASTLAGKPRQPARIYLDTGTDENQVGTLPGGYYWDDPWNGYNSLLAAGYVVNLDLWMRIGCGQGHNEAAWRARLPEAMRLQLDAGDEPNTVALRETPPALEGADGPDAVRFPTLRRVRYELERWDGAGWTPTGIAVTETNGWDARTLAATNPPGAVRWLRVGATPQP